MEHPNSIDGLREAMIAALLAQDNLLAAWQKIEPAALASMNTPTDIDRLRQLIIRGIYPVNAFEAMARNDLAAATDILLSRYLGVGVDPDRKFGGYAFELDSMLDDLREVGGEHALRSLVTHEHFARHLFNDRRVVEAFASALNIPADRFQDWVEGG